MNQPIFIADTCVCGLTVLKSLWKNGCASQAVFMADYAVNPLGVKSDREISAVVERWIEMAGRYSDTLVIACNTLSIRYHQLAQRGQVNSGLRQIVTMVDCVGALVRTEISRLAAKNVLIIGTEFTASQRVYPDLFAAALPGCRVQTIGATGLERKIARFQTAADDGEPLVSATLERALAETDVAVLACTCFPLARATLESSFPQVWFLDPGEYCAGLLETDRPLQDRTLTIGVTGDAVSRDEAREFAASYLESDSIVPL